MARAKIAVPTFLVEAPGAVEARDGLIRIDLGGTELALTPHAASLIGHRLDAAIVDFYRQQRERSAAVIATLPPPVRMVRCVGEAC